MSALLFELHLAVQILFCVFDYMYNMHENNFYSSPNMKKALYTKEKVLQIFKGYI